MREDQFFQHPGSTALREIQFQKLIEKLLVKLGYINIQNESLLSNSPHLRVDFIFGQKNNINHPLTIVEVKAYRPLSSPSTSVINKAIDQLQSFMKIAQINYGVLIISSYLADNFPLNSLSNIEIWDLNKLLNKTITFPEIYNELIDLLELDPSLKIIIDQVDFISGSYLLVELEKIPKGKRGAYSFEAWCIEALKYLFHDYLVGWKEQSSTIDGLQRRDLICRVKDSNTEVWQFISHTLRSRYVIFEFKNYSEKITQREIFTTERYIYPMALRNCAFIISREGASSSAQQVIEGAMREHGKLIISLSKQDMTILLEGKDKGDDPNTYLFNKIDDFLMTLNR